MKTINRLTPHFEALDAQREKEQKSQLFPIKNVESTTQIFRRQIKDLGDYPSNGKSSREDDDCAGK